MSIQSTAGHVESCGKEGGPSPKAKYDLVTDRVESCGKEGGPSPKAKYDLVTDRVIVL